MRRALRFLVGSILLGLLAISQADARGGGGGSGAGFAGFHGGFVGAPRAGFHVRSGIGVRRPPFARRQPLALVERDFAFRHFAGIPNRLPNTFPFQNTFPVWWGWPVGLGWPEGYAYQPPQQVQAPAPEPQVIVIHTDGQGRMAKAEATADYSYVKGCHAIANGYHCDTATETH